MNDSVVDKTQIWAEIKEVCEREGDEREWQPGVETRMDIFPDLWESISGVSLERSHEGMKWKCSFPIRILNKVVWDVFVYGIHLYVFMPDDDDDDDEP